MFTYLFKEPNKSPELKTYNGDIRDVSISRDLLQQIDSYVGYLGLTSNVYAYFDDNGVAMKDFGALQYNCNLPSPRPQEYQNQIFGNLVIVKYENVGRDDERAVSFTEEDFKRYSSILFTVPENQVYSMYSNGEVNPNDSYGEHIKSLIKKAKSNG